VTAPRLLHLYYCYHQLTLPFHSPGTSPPASSSSPSASSSRRPSSPRPSWLLGTSTASESFSAPPWSPVRPCPCHVPLPLPRRPAHSETRLPAHASRFHAFPLASRAGADHANLDNLLTLMYAEQSWASLTETPPGKLLFTSVMCYALAFVFLPPPLRTPADRPHLMVGLESGLAELALSGNWAWKSSRRARRRAAHAGYGAAQTAEDRRYAQTLPPPPIFCLETACWLLEASYQVGTRAPPRQRKTTHPARRFPRCTLTRRARALGFLRGPAAGGGAVPLPARRRRRRRRRRCRCRSPRWTRCTSPWVLKWRRAGWA
jgi:hypothetical protein